jgi:hypothetical protein
MSRLAVLFHMDTMRDASTAKLGRALFSVTLDCVADIRCRPLI